MSRVRPLNQAPVNPEGAFVLYWMTAARRLSSNFALQHAADLAREMRRPLLILEALRADYPWASDRLHRFVIDGMAGHATAAREMSLVYYPYVEPAIGAGRGLIGALAAQAAVIVTDDYPSFFLPRMAAAAARRAPVRVDAVDSNGLAPMRAEPRAFGTAFAFRAYLQRTMRTHLSAWPARLDLTDLPAPPAGLVPVAVERRWPATPAADLANPDRLIAALPIDHAVPVAALRGGAAAARTALDGFVSDRLSRYAAGHSHPDDDATSGLSPWLHFGHLSAHEVFDAVMTAERWTSRRLGAPAGGRRSGWWGASENAELFLDQLVTWRELAFNLCVTRPGDYASFTSLPAWAQATLHAHAGDPRPHLYTIDDLDRAATCDRVWNAAQRQLTGTGVMHNYLRMLWGKKILEWSRTPEEALATMVALMDRHALDGRDPNSYAGYSWVLGRFDRPWGPERPIFGTIRYMTSASTLRKLRMKRYLAAFAGDADNQTQGTLV